MPNIQFCLVRDLHNRYAEVDEYFHIKYVSDKLKEAEIKAEKPGVKWKDFKNVLKKILTSF